MESKTHQHSTTIHSDGVGYTGQLYVVENEGTVEISRAGCRESDEGGRVAHGRVDNSLCSNALISLSSSADGDVETDLR